MVMGATGVDCRGINGLDVNPIGDIGGLSGVVIAVGFW